MARDRGERMRLCNDIKELTPASVYLMEGTIAVTPGFATHGMYPIFP